MKGEAEHAGEDACRNADPMVRLEVSFPAPLGSSPAGGRPAPRSMPGGSADASPPWRAAVTLLYRIPCALAEIGIRQTDEWSSRQPSTHESRNRGQAKPTLRHSSGGPNRFRAMCGASMNSPAYGSFSSVHLETLHSEIYRPGRMLDDQAAKHDETVEDRNRNIERSHFFSAAVNRALPRLSAGKNPPRHRS